MWDCSLIAKRIMLTMLVVDAKRKIPSAPDADGINAAIRVNGRKGGMKMSDEDCEAVAEFIRSKGITRCPTACVLPTQGLITAADRIALEQHAIARDRSQREHAAAHWGRFSPLKGSAERR
jgi:hypothetical protein